MLTAKRREIGRCKAWMQRLWLSLLVHRDAFRLDPLGYSQGIAWRVRGLRVRSRNRLAALMGRSPHAYRLWIARVEPAVRAELLGGASPDLPLTIPIIDAIAGRGSVARTLQSLAGPCAKGAAVIVGRADMPGITTIATPSDLARIISPSGNWLCVIRAGDLLAADALAIYARAAVEAKNASVIYADDDLGDRSERHSPHFKSSWNPELFEHHDFITGSALIRVTPEMLETADGEQWLDKLTRVAIARGSEPIHLPAVLHHRECRPQPAPPAKPALGPGQPSPRVTTIVPTRNGVSYLRTCVEGVRRTAYPDVELIIVDNGSDDSETLDFLASIEAEGVKVLREAGEFNFSALNNAAVRRARGELLCFLNNDVEMVDPDWLSLLVRQAGRSDVGAVGGRLLYPDGALQHAGVVTGVGGGAAHAHRNLKDEEEGYFLRDRLPQRVSAVTAACLVVTKEKFLAVGGFNEIDFPVAFNDVDLCLKLNARGWQSFYEPRAVLIHHESKSRGSDSWKENRVRFAAELAALKRRWATDRQRDPFHHPHLSPFCEQFHIAV